MKWVLLLLALALLWVLSFTRLGVFLVFDVVGDFRGSDNLVSDPRLGPLQLDEYLEPVSKIPLPDQIQQPSGLACDANRIWISTDQAELFALNWDGTMAYEPLQLIAGPLLFRQGSVEGVTLTGDELFFAGELGSLLHASVAAEPQLTDPVTLHSDENGEIDREFTSIEYVDNRFVLSDDGSPTLFEVSDQGKLMSSIKLNFNAFSSRAGGNPDDYLLSGLAYSSSLFLVTENYSTLFRVDDIESKRVTAAFGLLDVEEISDVCVVDNRLLVIGDHNLFDEKPPITEYKLPSFNDL